MKIDRYKLRLLLLESYQTQGDLSKKSGVSRNTISSVCQGKTCSTSTGEKIADALGVPVEDLLEDRGKR